MASALERAMAGGNEESDDEEDEDFDFEANAGARRFPIHDCCEFEDEECLRRLIFVRQDDSDDDSSSSSSSGNDDESSSSDDNDSLDAAHAAAVGHSPQAVSHRGALNPRTPVGATAAVAAGLQTSIVKDHTTLVSDHQLLNGDTAKQPPTTEIDTNTIHDEEMGDSQNGVETKKDSTEAESPAHERAGTSRDDKGISLQAAYSSRDIKKSPPLDAEKNSSAVDINPVNDTSEAGVAPESNETMKLEIPKEEITMSTPKQGDDKTQQRPKKKRKKKLKKKKEPSYYCPYDLNERDEDENTPLHVAIHSRKLEHVRLLLEAGASIHRKCDGSFPIHVAISIGAIPAHASFAYECVKLLQEHGADFFTKDDSMHSPLYLACVTNQVRLVSLFLADTGGMGTLNVRCDRVGGRVLHAAARFDDNSRAIARPSGTHKRLTTDDLQPHVPTASLTNMNQSQGSEAEGVEKQEEIQPLDTSALITQILLAVPEIEVDPQNNYGRTPLHVATMRGNWPVVRQLLHAGANPDAIDRRGYKPGGLAHKRGMVIPNDLLPVLENSPPSGNGSTPRDLIIDPAGSTLLLCHELCSRHKTCPPIARGTGIASSEPPPENVRRLHVLINEDVGILRCSEFDGCSWETEARRAAISDILRVHEYSYVERISHACAQIPDHPSAIAQLDGDTAVSRWSFEAALRAAGSVCEAVDKVMSGDFRNSFCAVRPPGHHAGPRGIVKCANDPEGSHGFCLLNNVAIGAAYARTMYRNDGIRKVAIIDFDVHHGNGTEEIVRQLVPNLEVATIRTNFAQGTLQTSKYRPWLDESDIQDVFFASTHGFGQKDLEYAGQPGGWFYPASGKSQVTDAIGNPASVENPNLSDFLLSQTWARMGEEARTNCCKIINCGLEIPGPNDIPGMQRVELRDSYRKKILPYLMDFDPDLIFISAGFDAHKKDTMNFGYVGMIEDDYEWVTEQLVKVANTCCNGRIVSVLEGGYKIHGGIVSPFARSVASHVRALVDGGNSRELYDTQEGEWESQFERHLVEEKEKKRQMKIDRLNRQAEAQRNKFLASRQNLEEVSTEEGDVAVSKADSYDSASKAEEEPTRKRRRNQVDYKQLYEQMKKEEMTG